MKYVFMKNVFIAKQQTIKKKIIKKILDVDIYLNFTRIKTIYMLPVVIKCYIT